MTRRTIVIFTGLYGICFFDFLAFGVRPSNLKGLLLLPGSLIFVAVLLWGLVIVITRWKTSHIRAVIPLVACLLMLPAERLVGRCIRTELFNWNFPVYEAVVRKIDTGAIPLANGREEISATYFDHNLAYAIWAERDSNQVLTVEFLWGGSRAATLPRTICLCILWCRPSGFATRHKICLKNKTCQP